MKKQVVDSGYGSDIANMQAIEIYSHNPLDWYGFFRALGMKRLKAILSTVQFLTGLRVNVK